MSSLICFVKFVGIVGDRILLFKYKHRWLAKVGTRGQMTYEAGVDHNR